jgi:hypothetical protein
MRTAFLLSVALFSAGCFSTKTPIETPHSGKPAERLSELGVYKFPLAELVPEDEYTPYEVNVPLYASEALKHRLMYVPPGAVLGTGTGNWQLPVGTILVKTFSYPLANDKERIVETRFLVQHEDELEESVYIWNDEQTDAFAEAGNVEVPVRWLAASGAMQQTTHRVPGTRKCQTCHREQALGLRTDQLARLDLDGSPQLTRLFSRGLLDRLPTTTRALIDPYGDGDLAWRARGYLDVNCGSCHSREGSAHRTDVYFDLPSTDPTHLKACQDTWSIAGAEWILAPGHPEQSTLIQRMTIPRGYRYMPRGSTGASDLSGVALLKSWVAQMPARTCE